MKKGKKIGLGVGLAAAAAAAAAGAYFLYGPSGSKNRKKIKGWMIKARGEVIERMEKLKDVSQEEYHQIVDNVIQGYRKAKKASPAELAAVAAELKSHWDGIQKSLRGVAGARKNGTANSGGGSGKKGSKRSATRKAGTSKRSSKPAGNGRRSS